ncbi:hypothetical protein L9F63_012751 [Diploptera punctata]|uniref:Ionotropic glutamate receptor C-terminal domain-containing protein n=1 Tax=Diploptera punctata TaxID=6984 RepID=A0AAD8ADN9_DIPPU|nr:hypothetical protein L9F63_012751 [Diploptera punctata]
MRFPESFKHLEDGQDVIIDTFSKASYAHFKNVVTMLNASVETIHAKSWGRYVNGTWTGLTGYLAREEADIGATGSFMLNARMPVLDYIAAPIKTREGFIFRAPPLSYMSNIFTLPFSTSVWLFSACMIAVIGCILYGAIKWEFLHSDTDQVEPSWSDVLLMSLGAVCQQGSWFEARGPSGRLTMLLLFTTVIFLYTAYSACIVALLQSTADSIKTLKHLYDSGLEMGATNSIITRQFLPTLQDPVRKAIYEKKLSPQGGPENLFAMERGLEKVRDGFFAFHHELSAGYRIISDTYLEEEKCGLHSITFWYELGDAHVPVSKKTPLKEMFSFGYRRLKESGLEARVNSKFYYSAPKCDGMMAMFLPVGMVDFYPALLVLVLGVPCSFLIMIIEVIVYSKSVHIIFLQDVSLFLVFI